MSRYFFVLPQIDANNKKDKPSTNITSVEAIFPEIVAALAPYRCEMLHSKLSDQHKQALMQTFKSGDISALVATTIIEVGIDIPNATIITIFNAEQFGLSTLHQLRGRVGRGHLPGEAILVFKEPLNDTAKERLKVMYEENDGFEISEHDMKLRGPGDIHQIGMRQSGSLLFLFTDALYNIDHATLLVATTLSKDIMQKDKHLAQQEHATLHKIIYTNKDTTL